MSSKESIRNEFDKLKSDFKTLSDKKKITREAKVLFNALMLLMELMLSIFLEKQTKKNSKNSSKPSSQTEKDNSALSKGNQSKGSSQTTTTATNTRTVKKVTIIPATECEHCGESLEDVPCCDYERRTRIDIVFEKTVEHFDAEIKSCPACETEAKGQHPVGLSGPLQYGNGIKAYVIELLVTQMISLKRAQKLITTLLGEVISEATLLSYLLKLHGALAVWQETAKTKLLQMPCLHTDETALRVEKSNSWIHVYASEDITLKLLHKKRGKAAITDIGLIPKYGGALVHDCWASYLSYDHCLHGLCASHLLRELQFVIDSNGYRWATNMKRLLKETNKAVCSNNNKCLDNEAYAALQKRYRHILTRGEKELPEVPLKQTGRRGKIAKSDAHNLWERLKKHEEAVLLFARHSQVAFTNNRAERDLRMSKVKQKVSGCFRSEKYAHAYCRISSYLQTMSNKGINSMIAIQMALEGKVD